MLRHLQGHDRHWATYVLGARERAEVLELGRHWLQHDEYWRRAPLPTHTIRYEDLRGRTLPVLLNTLAFLLPSDSLPDLDQVACALEQADRSEAYRSGKRAPLQSLANYTPELRDELLQLVAPAWCRHGYDVLADGQLDRRVVDCARITIAPFDAPMSELLPPSS